jgi:hypothetical protein
VRNYGTLELLAVGGIFLTVTNNFGILVLFHAKPGRRDDKDHAASSTDLLCSMYNYGLEDENLIILYEIMKDNWF